MWGFIQLHVWPCWMLKCKVSENECFLHSLLVFFLVLFSLKSCMVLKCPYYRLWNIYILLLGVPNNRLTCMQGQTTLSLYYNMHLILPYLLNNSQTISSTNYFSKTLLCVTLIYGVWSDWSISFPFLHVMPDKAAFVSAVLLCVQPLPGKQLVLPLRKRHPMVKNEFAFSFRLMRKSNDGFMQQTHRAVNVNRYIYPTGEAKKQKITRWLE